MCAEVQAHSGLELADLHHRESTRALAQGLSTRLPAPVGLPDAPTPGQALCRAYELAQGGGQRRVRGAYYTPPELVDRTITWALGDPAGRVRVLDPACGGGAFLLGLARRLQPASVFGMDIDPIAVAVARAALWLNHGDQPGVSRRIVVADALTDPCPWPDPFDAVIGNPPYAPLPTDVAATYRDLFAGGRPNAFGAFIARTPSWVRPGGVVGLVLPRSLARVAAYAPLREFIANLGAVRRIVDVGCATKDVGYEQLVVVSTLGVPAGDTEIIRSVPPRDDVVRTTAPQHTLLRRSAFPLALDDRGLALLRRLEDGGPPLRDVADIFRGLGLSTRSPWVSTRPKPGWAPVLRGADVWRDTIRGHAWLDVERLGPRRLGAKRRRLSVPRIVLPNVVSSRIAANAAWDPQGWLALDTVTSVVLSPPDLPRAGVLAALNSKLGTWILRHAIFGMARLTNHMDAPYLGRFPLPPADRWALLNSDVEAAYGLDEQERGLIDASG